MKRDNLLFASLLLLSVAVLLVDIYVSPDFLFPTGPYSISILVAAYLLSTRKVAGVALWTIACLLVGTYIHRPLSPEMLLDITGLAVIGFLGTALSSRIRRESTLKAYAEDMAEERQKSINTLYTLIDTTPAGILVSDEQGVVTLANAAAKTYFGEAIGNREAGLHIARPDGAPFPPDELPASRALQRGESTRDLEVVLRGNGEDDRVFVVAGSPVRDENGRVTAAVSVIQDITERKRIEVENARLAREMELLLESTDQGICGIDLDGRCTFINSSAARMLGYQRSEVLGRDFHDIMHCSSADGTPCADINCPVFGPALRGEAVHLSDQSLWKRDGTCFPADISSHPIVDGGLLRGALITFTDFTDRKAAQEALAWEWDLNAAIADLSEALISAASVDDVSSLVLEHGKRLTGSRFGFVAHVDPGTGWLMGTTLTTKAMENGGVREESKSTISKDPRGMWGWVLEHQQPILINDAATDPRTVDFPDGHVPVEKLLSVPAMMDGRLVGLLAFANAGAPYADRDLGVAERLASLYSIAVQRKRVEESLRESEGRYSSLFESNRSQMLLIDPSTGDIVDANPSACAFYGWSREEIRRMKITEFNTLPSAEVAREMENARLEQRNRFFFRHRLASGELRDVEVYSGPIEVHGRQLLYSIVHDISERRRAAEEKERLLIEVQRRAAELDASINSIADALIIYGSTGEILRMNPGAERMFGYTEAERHLPLRERLSLLRVETVDGTPFPLGANPTERALRGETVQGVIMMIQLPGREPVWTSVSAAPIVSEGRPLGAISTFADITPLLELRGQQEDVLRMVSHDLRSPLAAIQGHAQMLDWALKAMDGVEKQRRSSDAILKAARHMNRMIGDLVDAIRVETGRLELRPEPLALGVFLQDFLDRNAPFLQVDRVKLSIDDLPEVMADPDRLERIVANLLSNAVKYSTPDTPVEVRAASDEGQVRVSIENQGAGIDPADVPHLFDRFYRSRGPRSRDSIGLGLYTSRVLVEAHGGRIWVDSEPGESCTFHFTMPHHFDADAE